MGVKIAAANMPAKIISVFWNLFGMVAAIEFAQCLGYKDAHSANLTNTEHPIIHTLPQNSTSRKTVMRLARINVKSRRQLG